MADLLDSWRLAVGTLTVVRVAPPRQVHADIARNAMLLASVAAAPLAAAVTLIGLAGQALTSPALVTAFVAVGALAMGSRCLHLDGLSDTVDGLTASYDRARSLEVMKSGTAGPAGAMALIVVIGLQTGALAALFTTPGGAILAGLCVSASRAALAVCCLRGVPPARADGLGVSYAGTVPWWGAVIIWVFIAATLASAGGWAGLPWWRGALAVTLALVCVAALLRRVHRRLGGVSGDVFGASVELTLACLLSALA